jgi:hypothetical protein
MSTNLFPGLFLVPKREPVKTTVILSLGMGVESVAILVRWIMEPETRPCPLEELLVITAMVGDEYDDTKFFMETFLLPLMRQHGIRYIQVARSGPSQSDGITVLDDSRQPMQVFIKGVFKLSDEMRLNGTVPQFGGIHKCAMKFKAFVIEEWFEQNLRNDHIQHAFGYNADETGRVESSEYHTERRNRERIAFGFNSDEIDRIERSCEYNSMTRQAFYPLMEWKWNRATCISFLYQIFKVIWPKSACVYCPFNALKADAVQRHKNHPGQVAEALVMEHTSLAFNPRGTLYKNKSLLELCRANGNEMAIQMYFETLEKLEWAMFRVRRIYHAKKDDPAKKGNADRAVEKLALGPGYAQVRELLLAQPGEYKVLRGLPYKWIETRSETEFPTREEFFTIAPATVETKARYGIPKFDVKWEPQGLLQLV